MLQLRKVKQGPDLLMASQRATLHQEFRNQDHLLIDFVQRKSEKFKLKCRSSWLAPDLVRILDGFCTTRMRLAGGRAVQNSKRTAPCANEAMMAVICGSFQLPTPRATPTTPGLAVAFQRNQCVAGGSD